MLRIILLVFLLVAPVSLPSIAQPVSQPSASQTTPDGPLGTTVIAPISAPQGAATVTVSGGTLIGQILMWLVLVVGAPAAGLAVAWIVRVMKKMGVEVDDKSRARLQEMIENGIALAAQQAQASLKDKLSIQVKNKIAADAVAYAQAHGTDTLKALGFDPTDPKTVEALQARAAKAIAALEPPAIPDATASGS